MTQIVERVWCWAVLGCLAGCAVGAPVATGGPAARIASATSKADGDDGASHWDVYTEETSMTWAAFDADGTLRDRLVFVRDGDALWLDVERDGALLGSVGIALSGEVLGAPDEATLLAIAAILDEAFEDAAALETAAASKEDGEALPRACEDAKDLTVGQVLRLCAASIGAVWRVSTGRGYEGQGVLGVFSFLADLVTPLACTGGMANVVRAPGSLSRYCRDPGKLRISSASMTCAERGRCEVSLTIGADRALPADVLEGEWLAADVYDGSGRRVAWGFPRRGEGASWTASLPMWDGDPSATYRVVVRGDLLVSAEATVRAVR